MQETDAILSAAVDDGDVAGVVAVVTTGAGPIDVGAAGWRDREAGCAMSDDVLFQVASMTKAVTSVAAMQCVERGLVTLDEPVERLLPELAGAPVLVGYDTGGAAITRPAKRPITLRHLLAHTSGLAYTTWSAELFEYRTRFPSARPIAGRDLLCSAPLVRDPGEAWVYGTSTDYAGFAVEAASGQSLDAYFDEHVFGPLGMRDTGFAVPESRRPRLAARYLRAADGTLVREAPPANPGRTLPMGGGGLFSTARDYARFMAALLAPDRPGVPRLLAPETFAAMRATQPGTAGAGILISSDPERSYSVDMLPGTDAGWGLGFLVNREPLPGARSRGSLAWGGIYNTYYWLDPDADLAGALLAQVLPFADPRVLRRFAQLERSAYAALR